MPTRGDDFVTETLVASAARSTSGDSGAKHYFGAMNRAIIQLDVTAVAGTSPSLTVTVEDTVDGANYNTLQAFTAATATGRQVIRLSDPFSDTLRVSWAITGTGPSFTFSVTAYAEA